MSLTITRPMHRYAAPITTNVHPPYGGEQIAELGVRDSALRSLFGMASFDGMEKPFILVPGRDGNDLRWTRIDMTYVGTGDSTDRYQVSIPRELRDLSAMREHGFAFGMDTNLGTVWVQTPDDNLKPTW
jgi:hypothetical protein